MATTPTLKMPKVAATAVEAPKTCSRYGAEMYMRLTSHQYTAIAAMPASQMRGRASTCSSPLSAAIECEVFSSVAILVSGTRRATASIIGIRSTA